MTLRDSYSPIVLCILDGWGISEPSKARYDAISQGKTVFWDYLLKNFPNSQLITSGEEVGLPEGQMGNSEVGHMTIGSGRVILQDLLKINQSINNKELSSHPYLNSLIKTHLKNRKAVHLLGLCSDGGVHSHLNHLIYIAKLLAKHSIKVQLHLFLDGRDVPPASASIYLKQIDQLLEESSFIKLATISGRFYAMDRDQRWDRTQAAYNSIVHANGYKIHDWKDYIESQYEQDIQDEFIKPSVMDSYSGIEDEDSIIFTNFRSDRVKQLAQSLLLSEFKYFPIKSLTLSHKIGMTSYSRELDTSLDTLFLESDITNGLGEVMSSNGKKQLRIAETEKYAHVTSFFNSGREEVFPGEERILVDSPKVRTYDLQPEMSADLLTKNLVKSINDNIHDLIVVNYANGDMVGHSGKMDSAIKAVEAIDQCLEKIYQAVKDANGILLITADHGNVECMFDDVNQVSHTSHTINPVPLVIVSDDLYQSDIKLKNGKLSDIAPTILSLMNIKKPVEMTGKALIG